MPRSGANRHWADLSPSASAFVRARPRQTASPHPAPPIRLPIPHTEPCSLQCASCFLPLRIVAAILPRPTYFLSGSTIHVPLPLQCEVAFTSTPATKTCRWGPGRKMPLSSSGFGVEQLWDRCERAAFAPATVRPWPETPSMRIGRRGQQLNIIECCGVTRVGRAFHANGVARFQRHILDDVSCRVVTVRVARWQDCIRGPIRLRSCGLAVDLQGELRGTALEVKVLRGDVEAARCSGVPRLATATAGGNAFRGEAARHGFPAGCIFPRLHVDDLIAVELRVFGFHAARPTSRAPRV